MKKMLICILVLALPSLTIADDLRIRDEIKKRTVAQFVNGNFESLNSTGTEYLKNQSRTPSGLWKLTLFYFGLSGVPNIKVTDPKYWTNLKEKVQKWSLLDEKLSFSHMVYVSFLISEAWMYRGCGWASKVRNEDWKPFHEKIEEARQYLLKHEQIKKLDPRWYEEMITIAIAQGWDINDFYNLLDEALLIHPQFYEIYFRAINYLQPKWHGSAKEIEKFATYAMRKSEAHEGKGMYARIYWYASQAEYGHNLFTKSNVRWEQMKMGINDVIEKYPDQWNINNFSVFSCLAKDKEMTKKLINMMEGRPIISIWKDGNFYDSCLDWANQK